MSEIQTTFIRKNSTLSLYLASFMFNCETRKSANVNYASMHSFNHPVLKIEGNVSCSRKQQETLTLVGFRTQAWQAIDHYPLATSPL